MSAAHDDQASSEDPDRQAILRRRQRFIATALSGLAASAATGCPQPCLQVVQPSPSPSATPRVCLRAAPPGKTGAAEGGDGTKSGDPGDGKTGGEPKPRPQPCLSVPAPPEDERQKTGEDEREPAVAPPQPCLSVPKPPDDQEPLRKTGDDEEGAQASPQPCLKVRRQD